MIKVFIGVIGSGKDYQATRLINEDRYKLVNFADTLRSMAWDALDWEPSEHFDYTQFKDSWLQIVVPHPVHQSIREINKITGRQFLQRLGTEAIRKRDPEFFCNQWALDAQLAHSDKNNIVVSDCRFPNEVKKIFQFVQKNNTGVDFIFCDYQSERYDASNQHVSESLAQYLKLLGYKDQQRIPDSKLLDACNYLKQNNFAAVTRGGIV